MSIYVAKEKIMAQEGKTGLSAFKRGDYCVYNTSLTGETCLHANPGDRGHLPITMDYLDNQLAEVCGFEYAYIEIYFPALQGYYYADASELTKL